jgi:membrane-bound lytic murein transglycosylase B
MRKFNYPLIHPLAANADTMPPYTHIANNLLRIFAALCFIAPSAAMAMNHAANFAENPEVKTFIKEMQEKHGFDGRKLAQIFARTKPIPAVIRAILPARDPASRSWQAYRARYVDAKRIALGVNFWQENQASLAAASTRFGVPEEIIVAIIGVETIYGLNLGHFGTFAALSTLAFGYPPRATLFRQELEELLLLSRETHRDPIWFTGSYAGALGLPQFLPSSVRRYAVSSDGNVRIDIAANPADAIASVANFLSEHGWVKDGPVAVAASVEGEDFAKLIALGIAPQRTPSEMAAYGVTAYAAPELPATLVDLATPQLATEYRIGYRNFYVLTRYNRSSFYAMAVHDLAQALRECRSGFRWSPPDGGSPTCP